mmetsp:Transcript_50304/g.96082  ORF Transcript_50304/g.96082 Transcript_50304/m.96082 type:complete len:234 (-) Transcript_50304:959-1660(-)
MLGCPVISIRQFYPLLSSFRNRHADCCSKSSSQLHVVGCTGLVSNAPEVHTIHWSRRVSSLEPLKLVMHPWLRTNFGSRQSLDGSSVVQARRGVLCRPWQLLFPLYQNLELALPLMLKGVCYSGGVRFIQGKSPCGVNLADVVDGPRAAFALEMHQAAPAEVAPGQRGVRRAALEVHAGCVPQGGRRPREASQGEVLAGARRLRRVVVPAAKALSSVQRYQALRVVAGGRLVK